MVLATGPFQCDAGPEDMLSAFYDTVGCRLEPDGRATRFPAIMGDLYDGVLNPDRAQAALLELAEIERELRALSPEKALGVVKCGPVGNALECFVSPDGRPLVANLRTAVEECVRGGQILTARGDTSPEYGVAALMTAFGAAWVLIGYKYFPNWILVSATSSEPDTGGIRIWTAGFLFIPASAAVALGKAFPRLRVWFKRRPWAQGTLAVVTVLAWILLGSTDL